MQLALAALDGHLVRGPLKPCYLVHGDEALSQIEAIDAIRLSARKQGYDDREVWDIDQHFDWARAATASDNFSLFAERKVVEIRVPSGKLGVEGAHAFSSLMAKPDESRVYLASFPKLDRTSQSSAWFVSWADAGATLECPLVEREALPKWLLDRFAKQKQVPDEEALLLVAEACEGNLLAAAQEVSKLGLLRPEGALTRAQVEHALSNVARFSTGALSLAFLEGDAGRFARVLQGLRSEGEAIVRIVWQLSEDVHALARALIAQRAGVPSLQALKNARVWGKRQDVMLGALRSVRAVAIPNCLAMLARLDASSKGVDALEPWAGCERLLLTLHGR